MFAGKNAGNDGKEHPFCGGLQDNPVFAVPRACGKCQPPALRGAEKRVTFPPGVFIFIF